MATRQRVGRVELDGSALSEKQHTSAMEILEAAARAFSRRGFAATSIDDVADELGCTKGRVYHYFRTKGELFIGIHRQSMEWALAAVLPVAESDLPPTEKLRALVRGHAMHMMEHADFIGPAQHHTEMNLAREGRLKDDAVAEIFEMRHRFESCFVEVMQAGIESGEFRHGDAQLLAKAALGAVNWMSVWYRPETGADAAEERERIASELADFAVAGAAAPAAT